MSSKELTYQITTLRDLGSVIQMAARIAGRGLEAGPVELVLRRPGKQRSLDQNRKLWPLLTDISRQVQWPVDGALQRLPPEEWKEIMTAGLKREQRVAQGIEGGFVMIGRSTSRMSKAKFADLIEVIYAFGAQQGVRWSEPALKAFDEYREAA